MKIGYARVSTTGQKLDRQLELLGNRVDKIYSEKKSGQNIKERVELQTLMSYIRKGDTLVITSLDRLSRNYDDITSIFNKMSDKGVQIDVLDAPFLSFNSGDNLLNKAMSDMFLSLLSYMTEKEREHIKERQRQGIKAAQKSGVWQGRSAVYTLNSKDKQKQLVTKKIIEMYKEGYAIRLIARTLDVSRGTCYKVLKENNVFKSVED